MRKITANCCDDEEAEQEESPELCEGVGCFSQGSWELCGDNSQWRNRL